MAVLATWLQPSLGGCARGQDGRPCAIRRFTCSDPGVDVRRLRVHLCAILGVHVGAICAKLPLQPASARRRNTSGQCKKCGVHRQFSFGAKFNRTAAPSRAKVCLWPPSARAGKTRVTESLACSYALWRRLHVCSRRSAPRLRARAHHRGAKVRRCRWQAMCATPRGGWIKIRQGPPLADFQPLPLGRSQFGPKMGINRGSGLPTGVAPHLLNREFVHSGGVHKPPRTSNARQSAVAAKTLPVAGLDDRPKSTSTLPSPDRQIRAHPNAIPLVALFASDAAYALGLPVRRVNARPCTSEPGK